MEKYVINFYNMELMHILQLTIYMRVSNTAGLYSSAACKLL